MGATRITLDARTALADDAIPPFLRTVLVALLEEIHMLEQHAESVRTTLTTLLAQMPDARRLMTVPGIGVLSATALVASVGDIHRCRSGRQFASWLGLTPREHSSGSARRLGAITRHGNSYLRMLLIHGARSALRAGLVTDQPDDLRVWATAVSGRHGHNVAPWHSRTNWPGSVGAPGATHGTSSGAHPEGRATSPTAEGSSRWRPVGPAWG